MEINYKNDLSDCATSIMIEVPQPKSNQMISFIPTVKKDPQHIVECNSIHLPVLSIENYESNMHTMILQCEKDKHTHLTIIKNDKNCCFIGSNFPIEKYK